jgi:decaprenyl-phosphate phosphoribosyltransferase
MRPYSGGITGPARSAVGTPAGPTTQRSWPRALLAACRPRQWAKNALVAVAPAVAGVLTDPAKVWATVVAVAAFVMASSGVYLINDLGDRVVDRAHPTKRLRPSAAGELSPRLAVPAAGVLLLGGVAVGALTGWELALVVLIYEVSSIAYSVWLKQEPVIELVILASGFLLRAIGGGAATHVALSQWFLITTGFASLFVAAGKRYAELALAHREGLAIRPVLAAYSETYLRFVWTMSAAAVVVTYAMWAFTIPDEAGNPWSIVSLIPFVVALLRYAVDVDQGNAGGPEEIILGDRMLLASGAIWAATVLLSAYL